MPIKTVEIQDAQRHPVELVAQVVAGTEVILTDGQTPRARLIAVDITTTRRIAGLHAGSITTSIDFDAPLSDDFWTGTS